MIGERICGSWWLATRSIWLIPLRREWLIIRWWLATTVWSNSTLRVQRAHVFSVQIILPDIRRTMYACAHPRILVTDMLAMFIYCDCLFIRGRLLLLSFCFRGYRLPSSLYHCNYHRRSCQCLMVILFGVAVLGSLVNVDSAIAAGSCCPCSSSSVSARLPSQFYGGMLLFGKCR